MLSIEELLIAELDDDDPHVSRASQPHASASMALSCARQIGYKVAKVPTENALTLKSHLAFFIGKRIHLKLQAAFAKRYGDFEPETYWDRGAVIGYADGLYTSEEGIKTVLEAKTMSTKGYEWAADHGPKDEHVMQATLSALALGATEIHMVYIAKADLDAPLKEWVLFADLASATREEQRMQHIVSRVVAGQPLPRRANGTALDPKTTKWPCAWCDYRQRCIAEGV
ncbi:MAG: hypothetical protein KGL39_49135 [Patescibacteria group bacterium]|nr:hypothetical protein [Patescibacteria group bacterium]